MLGKANTPDPPIATLLFMGCPPAVARLVVAIVVGKAINRLASRTLAHIGKKVLELSPPLAHYDAACSVFVKRGVSWSMAPPPGEVSMANSYLGRLHARAFKDARHAVSLETGERIARVFLTAAIVAFGLFAIGSLTGLASDTFSKIAGALLSVVIAPVVLFFIFYAWSFLLAPARLD